MTETIFVDTNIFIWGYNRPSSNSAKILDLIDKGNLYAISSERVITELRRYFIRYYTKDIWGEVLKHVMTTVEIIYSEEIIHEIEKWRGKINDKDLEQLATTKALGLKYLVAYDKHFGPFEEYMTPRQFIKVLGFNPSKSEY